MSNTRYQVLDTCFFYLLDYERKKSQKSGVLDGVRQGALVFGSHSALLVAHDFAAPIQKFLQDFNILVIYIFYIVG